MRNDIEKLEHIADIMEVAGLDNDADFLNSFINKYKAQIHIDIPAIKTPDGMFVDDHALANYVYLKMKARGD